MPHDLSRQILNFIAGRHYQPLKPRRLARQMGVLDADYGEFRRTLKEMTEQGRLMLAAGGTVSLPGPANRVTGVYRANRRGFGFVVPATPTSHGDLFIPPGAAGEAQDGDTVICRVKHAGHRAGKARYEGEIVQVVTRGCSRFVGQLCQLGGRFLLQPEGNRLREPIYVDDVAAKAAREGDQVVVEIVEYPKLGRPARGVIVERLGVRGEIGVDVRSMIRQYGLAEEFPTDALDEARAAAQAFDVDEELRHRLDLREELTVTIDPVDARDFDDAISLRRLAHEHPNDLAKQIEAVAPKRGKRVPKKEQGGLFDRLESRTSHRTADEPAILHRPAKTRTKNAAVWELGVHIADVSHFVQEGGPLDREARERSTSVYFPRYVVPMLPEVISNGVCSLQEGQPRLCKSAFIKYDAEGRVLGARFANTLICSSKRLTYEGAQAVIDGQVGDTPHAIVTLLHEMNTLARVIRQRRIKQGMLVLDLPEISLVLDENDRVIDARPADNSFTHTIIEQFMVEANEAVARRLTELGGPFLRRVHEPPDPHTLENLAKFLRRIGAPLPKNLDRADLQRLLDAVRGKPLARTVNMSVLRSMSQAVYSPESEGHYALASECYCHFTSPIRRYPDLHVHRLLQRDFEHAPDAPPSFGAEGHAGSGGGDSHSRRRSAARNSSGASRPRPRGRATHADGAADYDAVASLGRHCSFTERRAEQAERELRLVKVLELLARNPGEAFEGVVTGVANFGLFIQDPRFLIDGLIESIDLPDDRWELDDSRSALVGQRTGLRFAIGDVLTVAIARVDVPTRRLQLALVDLPVAPRAPRGPARQGDNRRVALATRSLNAPTLRFNDRAHRHKPKHRGQRHRRR